jgi:lipoprotein Spr
MVHTKKTHIGTKQPIQINYRILLVILLVPFIMGVSEGPEKDSLFHVQSSITNDSLRCDSLVHFAKKYLKKPYCYGNKAPKCFDCSGFLQFVYSKYKVTLPRSSEDMAYVGKFISFNNAKAGDLIFFNGSKANNETIGHVGLVTSCHGDKIFFIHASVHSGVVLSNTLESYYQKRLLFIKRVEL